MIALYVPALIAALAITVLELTEVVALVFALGADHTTVRHGAYGATAGTASVSLLAVGAGAILLTLPVRDLQWGAAALLAGFGVFLFRSTLKSFRRRAHPPSAGGSPGTKAVAVQFAGGFTVGAVETTEAVIVLLALTAGGYGPSAVIGALVGGAALVGAALLLHERMRRIKTVWLKTGATALLFSFAVLWGGEASGVRWPDGDLVLLPMFLAGFLLVWGAVEVILRADARRAAAATGR